MEQAEAYMNELFHRFISEEKNLEDEIIQSISEYEMNIASLNLELGHPVYTYRGSHLLIAKEKILKEEHTKLKYQKASIYFFLPFALCFSPWIYGPDR